MSSATTAVMSVHPRPGRIGGVRLHQVVLVEVAGALVLVGWVTGGMLLVPMGLVAAGLVLLVVLRRRGRPVVEWLNAAMALRGRLRAARRPWVADGVDPALAPVAECDTALRTYTYTDRQRDRAIGMVGDGTFLTALLLVQSRDEPLRMARDARPLPLGLLHDALEVDDIRLESVQVVQHTQPAPGPHLPEQAAAARSYAPLQAQAGTPAIRLTWIALKLDPELCPEAVRARGGGIGGAQRALLRATDQLASRLAGAGIDASVLTEAQVTSALATSAGVNPQASALAVRAGAPLRRTTESTRAWRCDDRWHTTYWVGRWPHLGTGAMPAAQLVALLTSMPALASTFSLAMSRGTGGTPAVSGYVRLTARGNDELVAVRRQLERAARGEKVSLVRLDREQLPGLLATLPLGGTR
ncbi:type VII secretion protein EccE [Streptomyces sp. H10-C2]|uniref:type VII secretion protein EccE n=1 Tax=unclassified Streptomyces TaxID=2593676 RepID=UPI0024BB9856|nr:MULTISPECIES: type VII secretion protein EccE [unclassified Streptomyces]MDJ0342336.1 type VII secretion protein EccE [Streptomyces sp. PH10-H1]MDJ0372191.1 type VII secretion protein EccE [Streptomyces sp. H10-C2]